MESSREREREKGGCALAHVSVHRLKEEKFGHGLKHTAPTVKGR